MPRSPWIGVIAGAVVLIAIIIWSSWGSGIERQARSAILQAQRNISAVDDAHVEVDREVLHTAEADLLRAQTAFNHKQFAVALEAAQRASQAAQGLLTNPSFSHQDASHQQER